MPLYVVRWPHLHASLVRARDEDELLSMLDEVDDPGGCTYKVYKGPVWVDFTVPFEIQDVTPDKNVPTDPADFTVDVPENFAADAPVLNTEKADVWTSDEMQRKVLHFAFPALHEFLEQSRGSDEGDAASTYSSGLRAALVADLMPLVKYLRSCAELEGRTDFEAELMKRARVTVMLPAMRRGIERGLRKVPGVKAD